MSLFDLLQSMDEPEKPKKEYFYNAPFLWHKDIELSLDIITSLIPKRGRYIEVFGGSAAVICNLDLPQLAVFNDRYSGVTSFFRCIRDVKLHEAMKEQKDYDIDESDTVVRGANWYKMFKQTYVNLSEIKIPIPFPIKSYCSHFTLLPIIQKTFDKVTLESLHWSQCFRDYDSKDCVFLCILPPISSGAFTHEDYCLFFEKLKDIKGQVITITEHDTDQTYWSSKNETHCETLDGKDIFAYVKGRKP